MTKIGYIAKEMFYMVRKYNLFILLPIFLVFLLLVLLVFYITPAVVISFIYAGV